MTRYPNPNCLKNAYKWYIGFIEREWMCSRKWNEYFAQMVFWYSIAGAAVLSETAASSMLDSAVAGKKLPKQRLPTWKDANIIAKEVCQDQQTNPVDWFTGGNGSIESGWNRLDEIHNIGPKIASFILRDLSLMRDYSTAKGGIATEYDERRNRRWFEKLSGPEQAYFIPIDAYVYDGARKSNVSSIFKKHTVYEIQMDRSYYVEAAEAIVSWSRRKGFDPREVDIYWYGIGSETIEKDGSLKKE
jgi:hypothetical protein